MNEDPRATYRELTAPLAQVQAAIDFVGQMEAVVADTWREREEPAEQAKAEHDSSLEFLEETEPGEHDVSVLLALRNTGLRFELDSEVERGGADGYFRYESKDSTLDLVLHRLAAQFTAAVKEFAPEPWCHADTLECLGWENLVLVPDEEKAVDRALRIILGEAERP